MGQGVRGAAVPPLLALVAAIVLAVAGCDRGQAPPPPPQDPRRPAREIRWGRAVTVASPTPMGGRPAVGSMNRRVT